MTTPIQIDELPPAPSRMSPGTFSEDMDMFLASLKYFQAQANALGVDVASNTTIVQGLAAQVVSQAMAVGAVKWVSGTNYSQGDPVWSPINFQTYRRKSAGAGTVDPANDAETNWALLGMNMIPVGGDSNFIPRRYRIKDNNTTWNRVCTITLQPGTYQGVFFSINVVQGFYNGTGTDTSMRHQFSVWCNRSGAVDLDNNDADLYGTSTDYVRVVQTSAGGVGTPTVYELLIKQPAASKDCVFTVKVNSMNLTAPGSIIWETAIVASTPAGTSYVPQVAITPVAGAMTVAGALAAAGLVTMSLGAQFGNTSIADANTLDWYEEGSFGATATGLSSGTTTGNILFTRVGRAVILDLPGFGGPSNATTFTLTGMPTNIRPSATRTLFVRITDNSTSPPIMGLASIASSGVITLYSSLATGSWTAANNKNVYAQSDLSYNI